MFLVQQPSNRQRWLCLLASAALHGLLLVAWLHHPPTAIFVQPTSVARGDSNKSLRVLYFSSPGIADTQAVDEAHLSVALTRRNMGRRPTSGPKPLTPKLSPDGDLSDHSARAGTPYGSLLTGPVDGHDLRPAFPIVFPDPPISRSKLSPDTQGDVVVEVTIDTYGNVVEMKLLQSVGHGIDEQILATLKNWRFRPATLDGRPIASKHDVYFHFPS